MKESAIAQLLKNCDITESKLVINVQNADGDTKEITLKDSEDFMNDAVEHGTIFNLVSATPEIYTGVFDSLEDEDGEYILYIQPLTGYYYGACLPYNKLVGYYTEDV